MATLRDRAPTRWGKIIYGIFAMGWRGSAKHWQNHQSAYLLLAGLAAPLVLSVHSVVSFDFATETITNRPLCCSFPSLCWGAIIGGTVAASDASFANGQIYGSSGGSVSPDFLVWNN